MQQTIGPGVALALLGLLVVVSVSPGVAGSPTPATAIPTPAYRLVYTVSNPSSVPTGPFDLLVNVDTQSFESYVSPFLSNEVWTYTDGEPIPSWIESNATSTALETQTWLRLDRGVAAQSSIEIWLNVYQKTDLLMDPTGPSGLAPQLTAPYYGVFDDGAKVFGAYDNFLGTAVGPSELEYVGWGGTGTPTPLVVNDSATFTMGSVAQNGGVWLENEAQLPPPVTMDALITAQTAGSNFGIGEFDADNGYANASAAPGVVYVAKLAGGSYAEGCSGDFHSGYDSNGTVAGDLLGVHSITWYANKTFSVATNYATSWGFSSGCNVAAPVHVRAGIGFFPWATPSSGTAQWVRLRLDPLIGSDPEVAFSEAYAPVSPPSPGSGIPGVSYFSIQAGVASESEGGSFDLFSIPEFVLAQPVGAPANLTLTQQIWQSLQVAYLGQSAAFENWSVSSAQPGEFTLELNLTTQKVSAIESGSTLLALRGYAVVGNVTLGASGLVGAAVLDSAATPPGFWEEWFGIPAPPGFNSPQDVIMTLADLSNSVAGRALYMASALVGATAYLYTAHKLAREKISGRDKAVETHRRAAVVSRKKREAST